MGRFVTGLHKDNAQAKKSRRAGFTPHIVWKDSPKEDENTRFVQFLTPAAEIPSVLMHQWIMVGTREDGKPDYQEFISRKNRDENGDLVYEDGYDPIWDRFGIEPKERRIAVAIEMKEVIEKVNGRNKRMGFVPDTRTYEKDGVEHTVLAVKLVNQAPFTFWNYLRELEDERPLNDYVWRIKRTGGSRDTAYSFIDAGPAVELEISDDEMVDLDAHLEHLASIDRVREMIDPLPDSAKLTRFDKAKGKGKKAAAPREDSEEESGEVDDRATRYRAFKDRIQNKPE